MHSETGQSLLEVIVAITVGILVVLALVFATLFSLRNAAFAKNSAQATKLAQEGLERVRTGRDRDNSVSILYDSLVGRKWSNLWDYPITGSGGVGTYCDNIALGGKCYFNVGSVTGALSNIGFGLTTFPSGPFPFGPETITSANQVFQRVITLSDDASTYQVQKTVTAIVRWTDTTGPHDSRVTTILRKL